MLSSLLMLVKLKFNIEKQVLEDLSNFNQRFSFYFSRVEDYVITMATYVIKVSLFSGEHAEFRVKNPKWIRFQELRSSRRYSLLCIRKGKYRDHVSHRGTKKRLGPAAGNLNPFNEYRGEGCGDQFWIEFYHDYDKKDGSESVKSLVIEKRDCDGMTKICDLHDFREENYPKSKLLDGFDTRLGPIYYSDETNDYTEDEPED